MPFCHSNRIENNKTRFDGFVCSSPVCSLNGVGSSHSRLCLFSFRANSWALSARYVGLFFFSFFIEIECSGRPSQARSWFAETEFGVCLCEALDSVCIIFKMNLSAVAVALAIQCNGDIPTRCWHSALPRTLNVCDAYNSALVWLMNVVRQMKRKIQLENNGNCDRRHKNVCIFPFSLAATLEAAALATRHRYGSHAHRLSAHACFIPFDFACTTVRRNSNNI